jgi:hypothetical protein
LTVKVNKATFRIQNFLDNKILRNKNVHIIFRLERTGCSVNGKYNAIYCMNSVNAYFLVPVAHTCHPSYSGGRDQKDPSSKIAPASSSGDLISKIPNTKQEWPNGSRDGAPA